MAFAPAITAAPRNSIKIESIRFARVAAALRGVSIKDEGALYANEAANEARTVRFGGYGEMLFSHDPTDPNVPVIAGGPTVTMVE